MPPKKIESITVITHNGTVNKVDAGTREAVLKPILEFRAKSPQAKEFLSNIEIDIASDLSNVNAKNAFGDYCRQNKRLLPSLRGFSLWEPGIPRQITIQESAFGTKKLKNAVFFNGFQADKEISNATMHEVGHQFDSQFGFKPNNSVHKKYEAFMQRNKLNPYVFEADAKDAKTYDEFQKTNGLSDNKQFKDAFLKDLKVIEKSKINKLKSDIKYPYFTAEIDFSKNISAKDIEEADFTRSEMYAQLFSYAAGEDDGNKEEFTKLFMNSYNIVRADIEKHLKIKTK